MRRFSTTLILMSLALTTFVKAQEINLSNELTKALFATKTTINIPGTTAPCNANGDPEPPFPFITGNYKCVYLFKNIRTIPVTVSYSEVKKGAIPDAIVSKTFSYKNCTSEPYPVADSISVSTGEGSSITTSTSITEGSTATLTTNINIPIKAVSFGINDSKGVSFSKTVDDSEANNYTKQETVTQPLNATIAPMTVRKIVLQKTLTTGYIDFEGIVSFEADVDFALKKLSNGQLTNVVPIGTLTSLIPNASDRTITLKGQIWNVDGAEVERTDTVFNLTANSPECASAEKKGKININNNTFEIFNSKNWDLLSKTQTSASGGVLTTSNLISGMSIETSDSIANVKVRAKSLGPGACSVTVSKISGGGQSVTWSAPPGFMSDWQVLYSHIGKSYATINTRVNCDTGALFEIQYYK